MPLPSLTRVQWAVRVAVCVLRTEACSLRSHVWLAALGFRIMRKRVILNVVSIQSNPNLLAQFCGFFVFAKTLKRAWQDYSLALVILSVVSIH